MTKKLIAFKRYNYGGVNNVNYGLEAKSLSKLFRNVSVLLVSAISVSAISQCFKEIALCLDRSKMLTYVIVITSMGEIRMTWS